MRIIAHRERDFPDDLEGRLNALLNVVNNELKNLTMLHLDNVPRPRYEIKARIRETVGKGVYLPLIPSFGDYCRLTLFPIGQVAEEDVIYHEAEGIVTGYRLTEAGRKYGRPIAAFTLKYVAETGRSMYCILSHTASSGKNRPPLSRVTLLEKLRGANLRQVDLISNLCLSSNSSVCSHAEALEKIGFVDYDSCGDIQRGTFLYEWVGKESHKVIPIRDFPNLTIRVVNLLKELKIASPREIGEILGGKKKHLMGGISSILVGLERQGIAKRKWRSSEVQSNVILLDEGRRFLEDYIDKVKDALSGGDSLAEMNELFEELNRNPEMFRGYARRAIELYKEISPNINAKPKEETQERIIEYLRSNPGKRPSEMKKTFSHPAISTYLSPLVKSKILRKVKERKAVRYYVNE